MRKQEEHLQEKSKSKEPKINVHQVAMSAQFGPPDCVTNFLSSSTHSKSVLGKRKCSKSEEVIFIPNTHSDALGRKVKMKFETSSGEEWFDGIITSYDGLKGKYGVYSPQMVKQ